MSTRCLLTLAAILTVHSVDAAQVRVVRSGDDRLTGIREVDVLITMAPARVEHCSLELAALQRQTLDTIRAAGIHASLSEKGRSWHYSIVVDVQREGSEAACAAAVATELVAEVSGIPDADKEAPAGAWGSLLRGFMPLVRQSTLVMSAPVEHDAAVQQALHAQVTAVVAKIRAANP